MDSLELTRRPARRTWLIVVAAAAVAAVTVGAFAVAGRGTAGPDRGTGEVQGTPSPAGQWRWESFGGVEVSVPAAWTTYGASGSPWCAGGHGQQSREIGRPGPVLAIGCPSRVPLDKLGEHVWLFVAGAGTAPPSERLGDGWVRDHVVLGNVRIELQTHRDDAVRRHILRSARQVTGDDANGCPVTHAVSSPGLVRPQAGLKWSATVTGLSACRYEIQLARRPVPGLVGSVSYDAAAATRILDAIRRAPAGAGPDAPGTVAGEYRYGTEATVLRFQTAQGVREVFVRYGGSELNGFDSGTEHRRLTTEAVAFMTGPLAQWSGMGPTAELFPRPR